MKCWIIQFSLFSKCRTAVFTIKKRIKVQRCYVCTTVCIKFMKRLLHPHLIRSNIRCSIIQRYKHHPNFTTCTLYCRMNAAYVAIELGKVLDKFHHTPTFVFRTKVRSVQHTIHSLLARTSLCKCMFVWAGFEDQLYNSGVQCLVYTVVHIIINPSLHCKYIAHVRDLRTIYFFP